MVKADVDHRQDNLEAINCILQSWFPGKNALSFKTLRGGYSGTNYFVDTESGEQYVIKIAHGYCANDVEEQAKLGAYLKSQGFVGCCFPYPLSSKLEKSLQYVAMIDHTEPAILLNYIQGRAADYLIEAGKLDHPGALSKIGYNLALMHLLPVSAEAGLRSYKHDGLCFLQKHLSGDYLRTFTTHEDEFIRNHSFTKFYLQRFDWLIGWFAKCDSFRQSLIHGDPFLDNVLFDERTGEFL
jgi:Ser/Thr protein kinase RdoA (MazF antagonist)